MSFCGGAWIVVASASAVGVAAAGVGVVAAADVGAAAVVGDDAMAVFVDWIACIPVWLPSVLQIRE